MREVEAGISFCLSLPLDYPGGTALNQRRHPPRLAPTEDMDGNAGHLLQRPHERDGRVRRREVRRRVGRRRGDARVAVLHAVGRARARRCRVRRRRRRRRRSRLLQRVPRRCRPRRSATRCRGRRQWAPFLRAPPRRRAHGEQLCAGARCAHRPGAPPRPRVARRRPQDTRGDHGGRQRRGGAGRHAPVAHRVRDDGSSSGVATRTPKRSSRRARTSTRATRHCWSGSPTRRSRR